MLRRERQHVHALHACRFRFRFRLTARRAYGKGDGPGQRGYRAFGPSGKSHEESGSTRGHILNLGYAGCRRRARWWGVDPRRKLEGVNIKDLTPSRKKGKGVETLARSTPFRVPKRGVPGQSVSFW